MDKIKSVIFASISSAASFLITLLGGWDWGLQTLVVFMSLDMILGILLAVVWGKSDKSKSGTLESKACFKGILRKGGILLTVLIATQLDIIINTNGFCRTAIILYFIGNEGLSAIENLGIMGVPLPQWLKKKLGALKEKDE